MRKSLVAALVACAEQPLKQDTRRFLTGLSGDELEFIAGFLGACILESEHALSPSRAELDQRITLFRYAHQQAHRSAEIDCKLILLREYFCRLAAPADTVHY